MDRRDFCIAAAASMLTPGAAQAGAGADAAKGADFSWLDARLAERVALGYFDGMSLMIGRGERVLHRAWFGDGGADAVLHVASTGKWTAVATIAALVDEGKLAWDDPVAKFLPEFADDKGRASLRQLLSHTAGYPDYQPEGRRRDDYPTLVESVAHIVDLPAADVPGGVFRYGGLAMQVAGRMAELAAGMPFDEIFQSRLARPLGMARSGYAPVSTEPGFNPMLGGGLFTCAADYARFLMMFAQDGVYRGKRILSAAVVRAMRSDQIGAARVNRGEYVESARQDPRRDFYGLGIWREEIGDDGQPSLLSSPGWAGAYSWVDRKAGLWGAVIAKANVERAVADGYSTFLGSSIYAPMARDAVRKPLRRGVRRFDVPVIQGRLYGEESGKGEAVILLHAHALDRRQWEPQAAALESHFHVIRYDLRGYGRSSTVAAKSAPHADDLLALMDALGVRRAHLVGHGLGGSVVADFIAAHPGRAISALMADADASVSQVDSATLKKEGVVRCKQHRLEQLAGDRAAPALRMALWRMIDEWRPSPTPQGATGVSRATTAGAPTARGTPALRLALADGGPVSNLERPAQFNAALTDWLTAQSL